MKISRAVNELILKGEFPEIAIDFFQDYSEAELTDHLEDLWHDRNREIGFAMKGILKERMPEVICEIASVDLRKKINQLTPAERNKLISTLKGLRVYPGEPRDFKEAVAAAGGVAVDEIDPATMESRRVPGLFITGELLDIDGDSGGFNLQFAWSTGAIAGMAQGR